VLERSPSRMDLHPLFGLPRHHYACILVDPPLRFKARNALQSANWSSRRDTGRHYETMTLEELKALPVKDLAAKGGCHVFIWTSPPFWPQSLELMKAWGFKYSTKAFTWVKQRPGFDPRQLRFLPPDDADLNKGLGLTTRKGTEDVVLGRRGNARRIAKDVREVILAPVREHSRKPDEIYRRIERYCCGPRVELFARQRWPKWDCWGNEVDRFVAEAAE
jgi:N6-adenosine-specific RNA methylase IME4